MLDLRPLRLAVMFDGEQSDIRNMAQDAVGQLALTAKGLGRAMLVKGAQTMDVAQGGIVNWTNWVSPEAFDQSNTLRLAHCNPSREIILGALHPIAIENENLLTVDPLAYPPRFIPERVDAVLIATGRDAKGMAKEFSAMEKLKELLNGQPPSTYNPEVEIKRPVLAFNQQTRGAHSGLVSQGTRIYSLATMSGVDAIVQKALSAPTEGMSFYGNAGEVGKLVEAMAITLADPENARKRLADNRFAAQLTYGG